MDINIDLTKHTSSRKNSLEFNNHGYNNYIFKYNQNTN